MATVPTAPWVTAVMVRVSSASASVSLANTLIALSVESSGTVAVSSTAFGASLTGLMVTVTWPVSVRAPSERV